MFVSPLRSNYSMEQIQHHVSMLEASIQARALAIINNPEFTRNPELSVSLIKDFEVKKELSFILQKSQKSRVPVH